MTFQKEDFAGRTVGGCVKNINYWRMPTCLISTVHKGGFAACIKIYMLGRTGK